MNYVNVYSKIKIPQWCVHSYYTQCPYAPDGSGRLLFSGCDPDSGTGRVYIANKDGRILKSFGENAV